jgi:WD40 repeat protein
MNFTEAQEIADKAYFSQAHRHLSEVEVLVLRGSWEGKTYDEMETHRYASNYLKGDAGPKLWRTLTKALGEKVSKRNFCVALERWANTEVRLSKLRGELGVEETHEVEKIVKQGKSGATAFSQSAGMGNINVPEVATKYDWGEAPDTQCFFGRDQELNKLKYWISRDQCRVIAVLGMRGIGKTRITVRLGLESDLHKNGGKFDYVIWRSLLSSPPFGELVSDLIVSLSNLSSTDIPDSEEEKSSLLLGCLRKHRCLIILDNAESILKSGKVAGEYLDGYSGYGRLIKKVGELKHRSCLVLTSREKPKEVALLEGGNSPVRSLDLSGLDTFSGKKIFDNIGSFVGVKSDWDKIITLYDGNPLALELVAKHIDQVFSKDISRFLEEKRPVFGNLRGLLKWHFDRLSSDEKEVLCWLAINYEPTSLSDLRADIVSPIASEKIVDTLQSLQMRLPIEKRPIACFTVQPVLIEYVTERLLEEIFHEILEEDVIFLDKYAISKATSKDYVREGQMRRFVIPLLQRLVDRLGSEEKVEEKLRKILLDWRKKSFHKPGYFGGNIITMLCELHKGELRGYDFSELSIWQANLRGVNLRKIDFSNSDFSKTKFTNTINIVLSVNFSPDGKKVVTGDSDHNVEIWNVNDGQLVASFSEHSDWVWSVKFNPDGHTLASSSDDGTIRIWEVDSGNCLKVLRNESWVRAVAYAPDGRLLASGSDDGTVRIWDLQKSKPIYVFNGHESRVLAVEFSVDGKQLLSCSNDRTLRVWEIEKGAECKILTSHKDKVQAASFSPDCKTLASGSADGVVKIWDAQSGLELREIDLQGSVVWSIDYSTDGKNVIVGSDSSTIRMYSVETGETTCRFQGHKDRVWSVASSPDGLKLASGSHDKTMKLWDIKSGACLQTLQGQIDKVWSIDFSPDGKVLASGSEDRYVRIWNAEKTACDELDLRNYFREKSSWVWSVAFHPKGNILATGSDNKLVNLWNYNSGTLIASLSGHNGWVRTVAFNLDGSCLASGGDDTSIKIWDMQAMACLHTLEGHTDCVRSVAFSPDGSHLASSSDDGAIRIWDSKSGTCINVLNKHTDRVRSVAFSPDGSRLVSSSDDKTIRVWNTNNGDCTNILTGHNDIVCSVAFGISNQFIISGSDDNTVKVWDLSDNSCLHTLEGHTGWVRSVVFSRARQTIASSSQDGSIILWDYKTFEQYKTLRVPTPYAGMKISGVTGINEVQKNSLKALGAVL